jgi:hypothetical protein
MDSLIRYNERLTDATGTFSPTLASLLQLEEKIFYLKRKKYD